MTGLSTTTFNVNSGDNKVAEPSSDLLSMLHGHIAEILSAGGVTGGIFAFLAGRKKASADAAKAEVESFLAPIRILIAGYEARAKADSARIEGMTREIGELRDEVRALLQRALAG